jgi:hypothetical protein
VQTVSETLHLKTTHRVRHNFRYSRSSGIQLNPASGDRHSLTVNHHTPQCALWQSNVPYTSDGLLLTLLGGYQ